MKDRSDELRGADDAINRVLGAEQAARERVAACRAEADALTAAAEDEARAIGQRAERRIRLAHRIADRGIERALAALQASESSAETAAPDRAGIDAVVAHLARELTEPGP